MPYRAGEDQSQRISRLLSECQRLDHRLTETYWALLEAETPGFRRQLHELASACEHGGDDPDRLERGLLRWQERLRAAIDEAPALRRQLVELPARLPPEALEPPWPADQGIALATADYVDLAASSRSTLLHQAAACLGSLDHEASLESWVGSVFAAPIRLEGAPMAVLIEPAAFSSDADITLTTPVRRALAPLRLERFTWLHTLTTAIQLQSDTRLGDDEFDDHFLVEASEPAARHLLDPPLRSELMALAHFATPRLVLEAGLATLSFSYTFSPMLVRRAAQVLALLRRREVDVQLLEPA